MKAILTGHSRGLGQAIAAELLSRGIPVLGVARGTCPELAARFPDLLQEAPVDLSDPDALRAWLAGDTLARYVAGAPALLLINNAGMLGPVGPSGRQDAAELVRTVNLNLTAPLLLGNAVAGQYRGPLRIAHISSGAGRSAIAGWSLYGATKAALDHHARCTEADNEPQLRICSIAPGVIDTAMQAAIRDTPAEDFPLLEQFIALKQDGKLSSPEEAAGRLVGYFLSDEFGREAVADVRNLPGG
ncbi:MAG TPA: SDR family oxidoreductase [Azonexus sp.]